MGLILRDVGHEFNLADSTLRKWLDAGVCGEVETLPKVRLHKKETTVLEHEHLVKLDRFLLFRKLLILSDRSGKFDFDACLELQLKVEAGNLQVGIDKLNDLMDILEDLQKSTKLHYQALIAELNGEEPIDPLNDDLDE
jgi:hypothetical protein